jgi:hypothetical protein
MILPEAPAAFRSRIARSYQNSPSNKPQATETSSDSNLTKANDYWGFLF